MSNFRIQLKSFSILAAAMFFQSSGSPVIADTQSKAPVLQHASFAEGCFWKTQFVFSKVPGVVRTTVGYSGGTTSNPTYDQVCSHTTGHAETCLIDYDPTKVTYRQLLEKFFSSHDPTTKDAQGPDHGTQYRSVIFYQNDEQKKEALQIKAELEKAHKFKKPIVTIIEPATKFYTAEEYHQKYFEKHGVSCE